MSKYLNNNLFAYKRSGSRLRIFLFSIVAFFSIAIIIAVFFGVHLVTQYAAELPAAKDIIIRSEESSQVLDRNNRVIKTLYLSEQRVYISLSDVSNYLQNAVVASEDERFFKHNGFDFRGFMRAVYSNMVSGDFAEGGSTITQQLARDIYLTNDKTITRKIKEIILSLRIEQNYKKTEILELYLNQAYFGESCYGVETASKKYFNKRAKDLDLAEASLLTAVLPAPSVYSLRGSMELVKKQQTIVLAKMVANGYITQQEADLAYKKNVVINTGNTLPNNQTLLADGSDYFLDFIKEEVQKTVSFSELYKGGLKIYTTFDPEIQKIAFQSLKKVLEEGQKNGSLPTNKKDKLGVIQPQGAVVVLSPKTGEIYAMVGGRDYLNTKFNRATALRQPGSAFKTFVYTAAIDSGVLAPESILVSEPINVDGWRPKEWSYSYFGALTVRQAIRISSNIAAVKAILRVGVQKVVDYAKKMGIQSPLLAVPSIALGTVEVKPIDMASAYSVIANKGLLNPPYSLVKIEKRNYLDPVFSHKQSTKQVISPQSAYLMADLLKEPISPDGTASAVGIPGLYMAGKTGTTENFKDGWFVGFTPYISIAIYVGSDSKAVDLSSVTNYGSVFSGKTFRSIMSQLYFGPLKKRFPNTDWEAPQGFIRLKICTVTGKLANITCPFRWETYIYGNEPILCPQKHTLPKKEEKTPDKPDTKKPSDPKTPSDPANPGDKKDPTQPPGEQKPTPPVPEPPDNPTEPTIPENSFNKPPLSDTDAFRVEFSSSRIKKGSPVEIDLQVNDQNGVSFEIFINGNLLAYLNEYPFRHYYLPEESGENLFQAVLKDKDGNILGTKILYFYVF
jgi:penicillin-binding protein 1A